MAMCLGLAGLTKPIPVERKKARRKNCKARFDCTAVVRYICKVVHPSSGGTGECPLNRNIDLPSKPPPRSAPISSRPTSCNTLHQNATHKKTRSPSNRAHATLCNVLQHPKKAHQSVGRPHGEAVQNPIRYLSSPIPQSEIQNPQSHSAPLACVYRIWNRRNLPLAGRLIG